MIRYPLFNAWLDETGVDELARRSGVAVDVLEAIAAGDHAAGLADQMRVGRALRVNPLELFALDDDLEASLRDVEPRYVSDASVLRVIDR